MTVSRRAFQTFLAGLGLSLAGAEVHAAGARDHDVESFMLPVSYTHLTLPTKA